MHRTYCMLGVFLLSCIRRKLPVAGSVGCLKGERDMARFAEEKDLKRVNEIRRQVNDVHVNGRPDIFRPGFCKEMEERIYELWQGENRAIIVAERDHVICGMACVEYMTKPESPYNLERKIYHVEEFAVDEAFRRQGVGTELFEFMKRDAQEKGFPKLELDVWEFNESAIRFYEAVGFHQFRRFMECKLEGEVQ